MKSFDQFIKEEADIKGNPAIPGEGDKKPGEPDYLTNVERRAKQRLGITDADLGRQTPMGYMPSRKEMRLAEKMVRELLPASVQLVRGSEEELSKLATDIIYNLYKAIIDRYEIELDIKLIKPGKVKDFMDECDECDDEQPKMREIKDPNLIKEIHKRKIANLIIQGEAKNTKHVLHSDEVKEGLVEVLGERKGKELFNVLDELAKTADQLDWIIPEEVKADMMEMMPDGMAGACSIGWKPKEKKEEDEEEYKEFTGEEDEEDYTEEDDSPSENFGSTPILRARGVDFSMLIHESVKGLFEILSLAGLPQGETEEETKKMLNTIYLNTGLSDEPQDFKYGPELAADLRDFVNENNKVDLYPNVREELWKLMIDKETLKTDDFLNLMRGILSKTEEARRKVDHLIDKVIEMIKIEKEEEDKYNREMDEYERQMKEYEEEKDKPQFTEEEPESDIDKLVKKSLYGEEEKEETGEVDYSTWSQRELQDEIDAALDAGDYKKVSMLSQYMKEGKEIYLRELEIINEKLNPHTK